jgi:hypothetical protein
MPKINSKINTKRKEFFHFLLRLIEILVKLIIINKQEK